MVKSRSSDVSILDFNKLASASQSDRSTQWNGSPAALSKLTGPANDTMIAQEAFWAYLTPTLLYFDSCLPGDGGRLWHYQGPQSEFNTALINYYVCLI